MSRVERCGGAVPDPNTPAPCGGAAVDVQHLTYRVGARRLLDDLSFRIDAGRRVAVVGPNGAGKTTLLRCLAHLMTSWEGTIHIDGSDVGSMPRRVLARKVAYLAQGVVATPFAFTVRQIVEMGRYPHLGPLMPLSDADESAIASALDVTGLTPLAERSVETLSGGERQKVFLAAALAQEPQVLLLDEPTTFLDYRHGRDMRRLLREVNRQRGTTLIEVTHDLNAAVIDCEQCVALAAGRLVFSGPPVELFEPERLRSLFGVDFAFVAHPTLAIPMVVPASSNDE